ncbi:unnamed protein product (macronuclear) [Paramecium tetraurelia]|uniref:Cation-transporting P-type ATPase N-terminal domain-containing protein n=1 Tax=Paramecium tetraurelia TaxID=5888 RepID=A0DU85_PARTE|nr:uncharacterized protein GSPATT00020274001 [Paramecium tetraurelia]CAK86602.1 unnamed protein product [Paramecium tetraurelia]|eukprot:XP_001453999.1 hypothetical protein (macronuclear) [Paramecium tetraurelia strain d4-2]
MFKVSKQKIQEILSSGLTQNPQDSMVEFNSTKRFEDSLKCKITQGLSENDIALRQQVFGVNEIENLDSIGFLNAFSINLTKKPKSIFFLTLSLIAFSLKYLSTQGIYRIEWIESLVIFGLISLNLIISAIHLKIADNNKKKLLLSDEQSKSVKVLRNGQEQTLIARDLVVGDVVILQEHDQLYVDGLIVEQNNLEIDESFLTGEQDLICKITLEEATQKKQPISPQKHLAFAQSKVIKGSGKLLVLAVGLEKQASRIMVCVKQEDNKTPILSAIEAISSKMETIGFVGAIVVIFMLLARYMIEYHNSDVNGYSTFSNILNLIIVLISGNASKALITHFQLQLAQTVNLMLYQQNLVKKLNQLENLPFMDQLLFDKTGTLTQNRMQLERFMNDTTDELTQSKFNHFPQEFQKAFIDACFINNTYNPETNSGSPIEKALLQVAQDMRLNLEERKKQVTHQIPFNSTRKKLTTIINNNRVVVRGASEIILQQSIKFYSLKDGIVAIDDFMKDCLEQNLIQLSQEGRTLAIAYADVDLKNQNVDQLIEGNKFEFDRQNLTLLGFSAIFRSFENRNKNDS